MMKPAYPELMEKQAFIKKVAGVEENRFHATLNAGMDLLAEMLEETLKSNGVFLQAIESLNCMIHMDFLGS